MTQPFCRADRSDVLFRQPAPPAELMPSLEPDHCGKIACQCPALLLAHTLEQLILQFPPIILRGGDEMGRPGDDLPIKALFIRLPVPSVQIGKIDCTPLSRTSRQQRPAGKRPNRVDRTLALRVEKGAWADCQAVALQITFQIGDGGDGPLQTADVGRQSRCLFLTQLPGNAGGFGKRGVYRQAAAAGATRAAEDPFAASPVVCKPLVNKFVHLPMLLQTKTPIPIPSGCVKCLQYMLFGVSS